MKCNTCGRQLQNEDANFCEYCGASFREHTHTILNAEPAERAYGETINQIPGPINMQVSNGINGAKNVDANGKDRSISFMNWLGTYALLLIPFVGGLIFLVMLFVWSFDGKASESKKNWARVNLIFTLIITIIIVVYLAAVFSSPMFQDMFQQMANGTFDYNTYYNNLYQNVK
jgi:hypothetical protein